MPFIRKYWLHLFIFCFIAFLFAFLRLYKLESSLEFYNDLGRDFLVMYDWKTTGKPPLLGPQTSTLAFNQSAWYFYALYPFYILFQQSLFSTTYAMLFYSLVCFFFTFFIVRKYANEFITPFFFYFFLSTIHPILITQQRFVWNPSFVLPTLTISLFGILIVHKVWKTWMVWIICIALSFAVSMSYSVAPALVGFFFTIFLLWKKRAFVFLLIFGIGMLFWNVPTVFFELRHHFLLTNMAFTRGAMPQTRTTVSSKLQSLGTYLFSTETVVAASKGLSILLLALLIIHVSNAQPWKKEVKIIASILAGTLLATLAAPFDVQPHYIFPILTLLFGVIAFFPQPVGGLLIVGAALYWLHPQSMMIYTKPALRTVRQLEQCARTVCSNETEPLFVSEQAGFHVFHTGPEYRFLFKKYGCNVQSLETSPMSASRMAIVVDNSVYEHGKTAYNELTIFGQSEIQHTYSCEGNIQVVMAQKK